MISGGAAGSRCPGDRAPGELLRPWEGALDRRSHHGDQQEVLSAPERVQLEAPTVGEPKPERVVADPAQLFDLLALAAAQLDARPRAPRTRRGSSERRSAGPCASRGRSSATRTASRPCRAGGTRRRRGAARLRSRHRARPPDRRHAAGRTDPPLRTGTAQGRAADRALLSRRARPPGPAAWRPRRICRRR